MLARRCLLADYFRASIAGRQVPIPQPLPLVAYKTALLLLGLPQSECRKFGQELADWIADRTPDQLQQTGADELQDVLELQRYTFNIRVTRQCLRFIRTTHLGLTFEHASEPRDMPNRFWKWPDEETDAERRSNEPRIDWRPFYDELGRAKDRLRTVWEQIAQDYGLLEAEYLLPAGSAVRATLVVNALNTIRLSNRMTKETDPELKAVGDQLATQVDYAAGDGGIYSLMRV